MDSRHKKTAVTGLSIGLPLFLVGMGVAFLNRGSALAILGVVMILVALPFYLWGCAELAKAKGYSTAIVLTFILGGLFPFVVLLVLPDKNQRRRW